MRMLKAKKTPKNKHILVTGAAGFIGYHLCEELLSQGYSVAGVDCISDYYDVRMKHKRLSFLKRHPKFTFYKKSITVYKDLEAIVKKEKPDEIVHLAAQAGVRYSLIDPWAYAESNYIGSLNVFEVVRRLKLKRVIYASSSSVYGKNNAGALAEEKSDVNSPISLYAASKRGVEVLARAYNHLFGIETIGLRFFTVYGPWGRPDMSLFIFSKQIMNGETLSLYNYGNMKRCFTYVSDVVDSILKLIDIKPTSSYRIYNLGGSELVPLKKYISLIEQRMGKVTKKKLVPMPMGDVKEMRADCSKAKRDLGYEPKVSIETGVDRFVDWFLENKSFLLSLEKGKQ